MTADRRIEEITDRIRERSRPTRERYVARIAARGAGGAKRSTLSCGNLAHGFAACGPTDKERLSEGRTPNLGIVTSYNDMLSAHQPFERYPELIREAAREVGATAQVAGGVPAMC
ncbi:MAG: dihydroxy-acid dehydratase, partial [Rhizobiaceae bacterium]|nr:dihydroxy-acid dehydratase [Rhizobiaceae bacterium]